MKRCVVVVALLSLCCTREPPRADSDLDRRDSVAAGAQRDTVAIPADPVARFRAQIPDSVLIRRGACPFECCVYGAWNARTAIDVRRAPGDADVAFRLQPGDAFRADSGYVAITGILLVAVHDSAGDPPYWSVAPGDTLVVLDHVGEGHFKVWQDGRVREVEGFWGAERMPAISEMIGTYASEWWVHATRPDGSSGWILMQPGTRVGGADACGG